MLISLVMASFNRSRQLRYSLQSICRQDLSFDLELVVVNDGNPADETEALCDEYEVKYACTGRPDHDKFRNPCIANNLAINMATGDIIILTCPEIYHLNNAIDLLVQPIVNDSSKMSVPIDMYFDNGNFYKQLPNEDLSQCKKEGFYKTKFPFFMATYRKNIIKIGGYDEKYKNGFAGEDDDLIIRLKKAGLSYIQTISSIVHMWHTDVRLTPEWRSRWLINSNILKTKINAH